MFQLGGCDEQHNDTFVTNGFHLDYNSIDWFPIRIGESFAYKCQIGYVLESDSSQSSVTIECSSENTYLWPHDVDVCVPAECDVPPVLPTMESNMNLTGYNSSRNYTVLDPALQLVVYQKTLRCTPE